MKYFNFLITVTAFVVLMTACDKVNDIVDSDKNIKSTKIELGEVKEIQDSGVIMPLKEGNVWHYKVTDYDNVGNILRTFNSTVKVKGEKIFDEDKWFEVQFPMISERYPVYMINTDAGLYVQCPDCPEYKGSILFLAKYPEINNTFYSGFIIDTINTTSTVLDSSSIWYQSSSQSITVPKGDFNCIKYAGYFKSENTFLDGKPSMNTYFKPDFGLVKAEIYPPGSEYIRRVYELIESPSAPIGCVFSETLEIGDVKSGETFTISRSVKNTTQNEYIMTAISIMPNDSIISFGNISPSPGEWLRSTLKPDQWLSFEIKVHPTKLGEFTSKVMFLYSEEYDSYNFNCWYGIDIIGNCTE